MLFHCEIEFFSIICKDLEWLRTSQCQAPYLETFFRYIVSGIKIIKFSCTLCTDQRTKTALNLRELI